MKKFVRTLSVVLFAVFISLFGKADALPKTVSVTLPDYKITVNGNVISNTYRSYPFISYNGITYFPLTYYDCRHLGLETKWNSKTGLEITKTGISAGYRSYTGTVKNTSSYNAVISDFTVKINGSDIDNAKEEYPLLSFRGVTYFPMTWKFCVSEFKWSYSYSAKSGLTVQSSNPIVRETSFKDYSTDDYFGAAILSDDCWYYTGPDGRIMAAPLSDIGNPKVIFTMDYKNMPIYIPPTFYKKDGKFYMVYRNGGATMGADYHYLLSKDSAVLVDTVGGVIGGYSESSNGFTYYADKQRGDTVYEIGGYTYCLASYRSDRDRRLYKVDFKTHETVLVCELPVENYLLFNDSFYETSDHKLYKINLDASYPSDYEQIATPVKISNSKATITDTGTIFYTSEDAHLYIAGKNDSVNPKGFVNIIGTYDGYVVCTFDLSAYNPYKIMVFDNSGNIVYKSSDHAENVSINNNTLVYTESEGDSIYFVKLK